MTSSVAQNRSDTITYTEDPGEEVFALLRSSPPWSLQQEKQVRKGRSKKRTRQKSETDHLTSSGRVIGSHRRRKKRPKKEEGKCCSFCTTMRPAVHPPNTEAYSRTGQGSTKSTSAEKKLKKLEAGLLDKEEVKRTLKKFS